ncbi:Concanavalin A-like lectin/glucanases superfamily [Phaffia rhodozyma]|uniref:Concanavalin A-like lectin/glucanases superfamily n=1 Tax=Phaffia rhodozyma TaxID=264483 RepID=A0A0F7SNF3_PHARH|nr:Concanavalin A-like lectin/glucanases superfamily [Phaffia rhodozyma]
MCSYRYAILVLLTSVVEASVYSISESHSGQGFFSGFAFNTNEINSVQYVNQSYTPLLASVNSASNAVIQVDSENITTPASRASTRLTSVNTYNVGTLWVFDAVRLPFGCSVAPGFGTVADDETNGEVSVLAGINRMSSNEMALHTKSGCSPKKVSVASSKSVINSKDCSTSVIGCSVDQNDTLSFGDGFNTNGGGAWVMALEDTGVSIWFYNRSSVPSSFGVNTSSIDTSALGTPTVSWSQDGCSPINSFISQQRTYIDISLCGDRAGNSTILGQTGCTVPQTPDTCYSSYILNSANYQDMFFEISYVNVFTLSANQTSAGVTGSSHGSRELSSNKGWYSLLGMGAALLWML